MVLKRSIHLKLVISIGELVRILQSLGIIHASDYVAFLNREPRYITPRSHSLRIDTMKLKKLVGLAAGSGLALATMGTSPAQAVLLVTTTNNATTLGTNVVGSGITASGYTYTGGATASGIFSGGLSAGVGIDQGIILTTGNASLAPGPNNSAGAGLANNAAGDASLTTLAGSPSLDASVLSFNFTTDTSDVFIKFVFASEEYPEYVNAGVNDVFGFFLDGQNIALVPGTNTPISIDTINAVTNSSLYKSNSANAFNLQYDGLTTVLTANKSGLTPGSHTIKIAIADVGDRIYDSAVFLQLNGFAGTDIAATSVPEPFTIIGSLVGGTAAFRMRKKLKSTNKA
jgi:hypothetical protein